MTEMAKMSVTLLKMSGPSVTLLKFSVNLLKFFEIIPRASIKKLVKVAFWIFKENFYCIQNREMYHRPKINTF